jgi:uncharacterized repeat protein (TIGR03943 family)
VRRDTQHLLLLLLGGALLRITVDETFLRYVRPGHRWLLIGAGLLLVGLGVVALWRERHGTPDSPDSCSDHSHGTGTAWLLALPVLTIALVPPPALGADAVARAGSTNPVVADAAFDPLPPGPAELGLSELVYRAAAGASGGLDDRVVTVTGFIVRRGGAIDLARLRIACCAADARPSRVRLAGDLGPLPPDTWLRVRGTIVPGSATAATGYVPTLAVTSAEPITVPADPYEY